MASTNSALNVHGGPFTCKRDFIFQTRHNLYVRLPERLIASDNLVIHQNVAVATH